MIADCQLPIANCHSADSRRARRLSIGNRQSTIDNGFRGFTLIELMVVVVVILILLGISAGVGQWAIGSGEEQLTKTVLANTQQIFDEYTSTVGVSPSGWPAGTGGTSTLVSNTKNLNAFKAYYSGIPDNMKTLTSNIVKDAWGATLHFVPANATYSGNPQRTAAYFVSAGRDGNVSTTGDNLYSYQTVK